MDDWKYNPSTTKIAIELCVMSLKNRGGFKKTNDKTANFRYLTAE